MGKKDFEADIQYGQTSSKKFPTTPILKYQYIAIF